MTRSLRLFGAAIVFVVAFAVGLPQKVGNSFSFGVSAVEAQEKRKRKSLFSVLFGRRDARKKRVKKRVRAQPRKTQRTKKRRTTTRKKRTTRSASVTKRAAAVAAVEKSEDAKVVLVIGDFFSGGLADGLVKAYATVPGVTVVDRSNGLSGLVRDDVTDWAATLPGIVEEMKPDYIVTMLGSNDRQQMRVAGKREDTRSLPWDAEYGARVASLAAAMKATNLPYTWVGLPPVRFKSVNKDWLYFNGVYSKVVQGPAGQFVDVWDGFSDAEGNYTRSGPDVSGQIVLLRSKDGINLTRAGKERLAFYVQDDILKRLGEGAGGALAGADPSLLLEGGVVSPSAPTYDPVNTGRTIVMGLDDPQVDGANALAGAEALQPSSSALPKEAGIVVTPVSASANRTGRVDDAAWPPAEITPTAPAAVAQSGS
ncbi:DUF459 domain-containing protein [Ahrensia sp. R2A130]|uniref:SGNH/GDSL hydrolase family protein n=1 Tax=Ahrensia sp. R2A130 TaxID=744979 RepID=UPI0001E0C373|nr:DUF459 domain-containing protein [Ahrensia sp. R2A130]EFL88789.1 probable periplasmic protein [Ahrensia sp. R2A130]